MKNKQPSFRGFIQGLIGSIRNRVGRSIRMELIITFALCLFISAFIFKISEDFFSNLNRTGSVEYSSGIHEIDEEARLIGRSLANKNYDINISKQEIHDFINSRLGYLNIKVLITDLDGSVMVKSDNSIETKVDIPGVISKIMDMRLDKGIYREREEFICFYPVNFKDMRAYLIVSGVPRGYIVYSRGGGGFLASVVSVIAFIILFFTLSKKKMKYIKELANGLSEISRGHLEYRVPIRSRDELGSLASSINLMAGELKSNIDKERKAEKTKNELITNVSHDLRTPLTSVIGYLRLLKDKKYDSQGQADSYIDIVYNKSEKLKTLVEDLFEYTKLTDQGIKIEKEKVNLNEMLEQLIEEFVPISEENNLTVIKEMPREKIIVDIDGDKMVRVFENLLTNAVKHSKSPGEIRIKVLKEDKSVMISVSNNGDKIPVDGLPFLFERFYRVEKSRASDSGGSGLGLAIAKSIVEMHGGTIWAECRGDEIFFNIRLERWTD